MSSGYICKNCGAESPVGIGYVGEPERPEPIEDCEHPHVVDAWSLIGAEGRFRIQGGRAFYEAVMRNEATARSNDKVRLCRLDVGPSGVYQFNRWVNHDTRIEVLPPKGES
jgi:hypothetical protein